MRLTAAERLLQDLGITEPDEIDLEAIAFHLNASVRYSRLDGCEARIIGTSDKAIITIGEDAVLRRKRFSLAHEIGHWTHHRGQRLVCRVEESAPQDRMSPERVANQFAADLLMPRYIFAPAMKSCRRLDLKAVMDMSTLFNTSRHATAIRMVEIGHFFSFLVCHSAKGRKWHTMSQGIPQHWFPRQDLDPDSFAFSVLYSGNQDDPAPRKIDADAWFDRFDASKYSIHEQTMRSGPDEILTLLTITDERMLEERDR